MRETLQTGSGGGSEMISDDGPLGHATKPCHAEEAWPTTDTTGRVPSLAEPDEAAAATPSEWRNRCLRTAAREELTRATQTPTAWHWHGDTPPHTTPHAKATEHPITRLYARAWHIESGWTPTGSEPAANGAQRTTRRVLWRGVRPNGLTAAGSEGIPAERHVGGLRQHALDVAEGSRRRTRGLSLTKDPFIAARYAAQSAGGVLCVDTDVMLSNDRTTHAEAVTGQGHTQLVREVQLAGGGDDAEMHAWSGSCDFSTDSGSRLLLWGGADERAVGYAAADAEWRHGGAVGHTAIRRGENGKPLTLAPAVARSGDARVAKLEYEVSMPPTARDEVADFASACEGKGLAWRASNDGPAVRLEWREARDMSTAATYAMAHMSLTLHDAFSFTDACAVDGSYLKSRDPNEVGQAAWAVWWGVDANGRPAATGGAMEAGNNIADAELTAIDACMAGAEERTATPATSPRLLILSDCTAVLTAIERARSSGAAWRLHLGNRAARLESIMTRWERWLANGGELVLQWTPAHRGVFPNHYADVTAKAYLGRKTAGAFAELPRRQGTLIQYGVELQDGSVSWAAGDRRLLPMVQSALGKYELRRTLDAAHHTVGELIVNVDSTGAWPWKTAWTAVLTATSRDDQGGGTKQSATALGAIMRVRAGQLGLGGLDYAGNAAARAPQAIATVWRSDGTGAGYGIRVHDGLKTMATAIAPPARGTHDEYTDAIAEAMHVVAEMQRRDGELPDATVWRRTRAAISGALPEPSRREKTATRERMAATAAVAGDAESRTGRDGERLSAMALAATTVAAAARTASLALCNSARAWQRIHEPTWQGGTVGEHADDDNNDGIDDEEDGGEDDGLGEDDDDDDDDNNEQSDDDDDEAADDPAAARAWDERVGPDGERGTTNGGSSHTPRHNNGDTRGNGDRSNGRGGRRGGHGTGRGHRGHQGRSGRDGGDNTNGDYQPRDTHAQDDDGHTGARSTGANDHNDDSADGGASGMAEAPLQPSRRFAVAGSERAETRDAGRNEHGVSEVPIDRGRGGALGNPFPIIGDDPTNERRRLVCEAHRRWLQLGSVPAGDIRGHSGKNGAHTPPRLLRTDGTEFPPWMRAQYGRENAVGNDAREALRARLNERRTAKVIRFVCSRDCGRGALCHGDALAEMGREIAGERDLRMAQAARAAATGSAANGRQRKTRSDKGVRRGPRKTRGPAQHRMSELSFARYRLGGERQVNAATRTAVAAAAAKGGDPWNEHLTETTDDDGRCEACSTASCDSSSSGGAVGGDEGEHVEAEWTLDDGSLDLGAVIVGSTVDEEPTDDDATLGETDDGDSGTATGRGGGGMASPPVKSRRRRRDDQQRRQWTRRQIGDEIATAAGDAQLATGDGGDDGDGDDGDDHSGGGIGDDNSGHSDNDDGGGNGNGDGGSGKRGKESRTKYKTQQAHRRKEAAKRKHAAIDEEADMNEGVAAGMNEGTNADEQRRPRVAKRKQAASDGEAGMSEGVAVGMSEGTDTTEHMRARLRAPV